jgi:hypothetical protein
MENTKRRRFVEVKLLKCSFEKKNQIKKQPTKHYCFAFKKIPSTTTISDFHLSQYIYIYKTSPSSSFSPYPATTSSSSSSKEPPVHKSGEAKQNSMGWLNK